MTNYYYIRNLSTGQAITADNNSNKYAILKSVNSGDDAQLQQWEITSSGHIRSKAQSNNKHYYLTMNKTSEDTHILSCLDGDSHITDNQSLFKITSTGGIKNKHYGYFMYGENDDKSSVGYNTIKVKNPSNKNYPPNSYRWALIPINHQYGLTVTTKPTTHGGLMSGTVDGALNTSFLRLYVYQQSGSNSWMQVGDPITPRPNGSWAVNVTGASNYGLILTVSDVAPHSSYGSFPTQVSGDSLAVQHFAAAPSTTRYAAQLNTSYVPLLTLNNYPFEFIAGENFTIEMWVRVTKPSTFFCTKTNGLNMIGWDAILLGMLNKQGQIVFGIANQSAPNYLAAKFESEPTLVGDGSWHHVAAMRMGEQLAIFLDGQWLKGTQSAYNAITGQQVSLSQTANILITGQQYATFGGGYYMPTGNDLTSVPYSVYDYGFYGALDNARVWKKALAPYELRSAMAQVVNNSDSDLLGNWTFDAQNGANSATSHSYSVAINSATTYDSQNVVQPQPAKQPYLTAQCKLMQDYNVPSQNRSVTTYHTVLSLWDGNGNRMPNANIYLKADSNCAVYVPQSTGYDSKSISTTLRQFTTNSSGEFTFSYAAGDDLTTPMFAVQTDFMASDEWLLIFPDRHAHHSLATLTGDQLLHSNPNANLTQKLTQNSVNINVANSLASAVNNVMASALEHDVQGGYPLIWLLDEPAENVFKPTPRLYQDPITARKAYVPQSNVASMHYVNSNSALERIVSGDAMPVKNWQFENNAFSTISQAQTQAQVKSSKQAPIYLNTAAAVNQAMIDSGKTSFTREEVASFVRQYTMSAKTLELYSLSDLWDDIKNAAKVVVNVVEHVIEDVSQALQVVSVWIDDVKNYVLQTVDDAISMIGGLFGKFQVVAQDIVDFIRAVFDWDDILATQRVIKQYLTGCVPNIKNQVNTMKSHLLSGLNTIQSTVDQYLDRAIAALSDESFGDGQSRIASGDPQDIQGSYIQRNTTTYMTQGSPSVSVSLMSTSNQASIESIFQTLISDVQNDIEGLKSLIADTPSFTTLFSDPQAFFKAGVKDVISALKLLWDVTIDLFKAGVAGVFDAFSAILTSLDTLMKTHIVIPFVTDLYEHVINPGQSLTGYDLMALLAAAPLTVAYKLVHGGQAPVASNAKAVNSFMALPAESYPSYFASAKKSTSQSNSARTAKLISAGLGYLSGGAVMIQGACKIADELELSSPIAKFVKTVEVMAGFVDFLAGTPVDMVFEQSAYGIFKSAVWGTTAIPLILDGAELFTQKSSSAYIWSDATLWNLLIRPGINIGLGVIHGLAYIASGTWQTVDIATSNVSGTEKGLGITEAWLGTAVDVISAVPELDKVLLFSVEFAELVPPIDAAAYITTGLGRWVIATMGVTLDI